MIRHKVLRESDKKVVMYALFAERGKWKTGDENPIGWCLFDKETAIDCVDRRDVFEVEVVPGTLRGNTVKTGTCRLGRRIERAEDF